MPIPGFTIRVVVGKVDMDGFNGRDYRHPERSDQGRWGTVLGVQVFDNDPATDHGVLMQAFQVHLDGDVVGRITELIEHEIAHMEVVRQVPVLFEL